MSAPNARTDRINTGLSEAELDAHGGFAAQAFQALAFLRETWIHADVRNQLYVETAIQSILWSDLGMDPAITELCRKILTVGMTPTLATTLWAKVTP